MSNIGESHNKRKLKLQNLSIFDRAIVSRTYYTWNEDQMKTGPNDIETAVYDWLLEQANYGATEVSLCSDSCGGQSRNKYLVAMCICDTNYIN